MDMVLYSLLKNRIASTSSSKVDNVGGYEIRFADSIPTTCEQDTLYIITRDMNSDDKFIVGGKGIECIVFNDIMIGLGVLNGNIFFDGYDFLYDVRRVLFESTNGQIVANNTRGTKIKELSMTGRTVIEDNKLKRCYVNNLSIGNQIIYFEKELYSTPSYSDVIDYDDKTFTKRTFTCVLDGSYNWRSLSTDGDYTTFRLYGYTNKPEFLTYSVLFNHDLLNNPTSENAVADNGFTIGQASSNECVYVYNSALCLKINTTRLSSYGGTTATYLKKYLTDNPISVLMERVNPIIETLDIPTDILAQEGTTQIDIEKGSTDVAPILKASMPISNQGV